MDTLTGLSDIVRVVGTLADVANVRIEGTDTSTKIFVKVDRFVVVNGQMHEPIDGINFTCGINDLQLFSKIVGAPGFDQNTVTTTVFHETQDEVPYVEFVAEGGDEYKFALLNERLAYEWMSVPTFLNRTSFPVSTCLEQSKIGLLKYWYKALEDYDPKEVWVGTDSTGRLMFTFVVGLECSNCRRISMANGIVGKLTRRYAYDIKTLLDVLKLSVISQSLTMHISDMGVMRIDVDSGLGMYKFYMCGYSNFHSV